MRAIIQHLIGVETGTKALECGLIMALVAVALVVEFAGFDPTERIDYPQHQKLHWQVDRIS